MTQKTSNTGSGVEDMNVSSPLKVESVRVAGSNRGQRLSGSQWTTIINAARDLQAVVNAFGASCAIAAMTLRRVTETMPTESRALPITSGNGETDDISA